MSDEKNHKVSKKHFEYFKGRCRYWKEKLGLTEWQLYFAFRKEDEKFAWVNIRVSGRVATIGLNAEYADWLPKPDKSSMDKHALHEVLHILLAKLEDKAYCYVSIDEVDRDSEEIVNRLAYIITKKNYESI